VSSYEAPEPFWRNPENFGPNRRKYDTPGTLWEAATEYFDWVDKHPLKEQQVFHHKGAITKTMLSKARPYTKRGLCTFLGITIPTYDSTVQEKGFEDCAAMIEQIIYTQKFEGAAAGFFNASIISRDLGLVDRAELSGPNGGPLRTITSDMTPQEAAEAYAATLSGDAG
jgi:hypothetical protein